MHTKKSYSTKWLPSSCSVMNCCFSLMLLRCVQLNPSVVGVSSPVPTLGSTNKKAKSRLFEKEGRYRNRLSHTSPPAYLTKDKRFPPVDMEDMGVSNFLPGAQQQLSRRQRSVIAEGKRYHDKKP